MHLPLLLAGLPAVIDNMTLMPHAARDTTFQKTKAWDSFIVAAGVTR